MLRFLLATTAAWLPMWLAANCVCAEAVVPANATEASAEQADFFEQHIRPVLAANCYECHSAEADILHGGLRVDTREGLLAGGDSGPAVTPGDVDDSLLLDALRHDSFEMPPAGKLPDHVIANFAHWIRTGAYDPREAEPADANPRELRRDDGILNRIDYEAGRQHWAFQPPTEQTPPPVRQADWVRTPIDTFVLARLEAADLTPSAEASRQTLLRRLKFDLLGLPPTPEELDAFLADTEPGAYERLVDRLLASPHYGERWGRHWLDVVRYSDSNGLDENYHFGFAWRYRDYVVRALNEDKPYDEFLTEQLAGDLLAQRPEYQADADRYADAMTATTMLAIGPKMQAERDNEKRVMDTLDELIDVTSQAFMGLSVACARCHHHKFDPISTNDYYAMAGLFRCCAGEEGKRRDTVALPADQAADFHRLEQRRQALQAEDDAMGVKLRAMLQQVAEQPDDVETLLQQIDELKANRAPIKQEKARVLQQLEAFPMVHTMHHDTPRDVPVHIRGNHMNVAKKTTPRGMLPLLTHAAEAPDIPADEPGRLQLAEWLTDPQHPLTARVMVNRIWQGHFGQGLVRTPNDFGYRGSPPTHPELLDYLACEFVREGWSIKRLHRQILLSSTYRQASLHRDDAAEIDSENDLLWRQNRRRLEVEPLRDNLLAVGGLLDTAVGGRVFDFPNGKRVTDDQSTNLALASYASHRRAIYLPVIRVATYAMFSAFDMPDPSRPLATRPASVVAPQALFLMNGELASEAAAGFASRLLASQASDATQMIDLGYRLAYCRLPSEAERDLSLAFLGQNTHLPREQLWQDYCQALMAASEFIYID